ncbi:polyketide synthase PksB [Zopfia rhizophila CBS 207.26]|uniref:Polyketide synthase PksB n=1 Tax=Zopfia rhizophila CBS 207.26 TaxID=1314779 RepID=A0A6A6DE54_9PEZI|nr:polyketide synthase PksB [Zopfia rhizophila CBS 207.26]
MTTAEPIAIIGSACRFPGDSDTPSKLWELLRSPRDLLRQVPPERYDAEAFYHPDPKHHGTTDVRKSYFLNEDPASFDNSFFNIPPGEAEAIDPQQGLLMETVYDSLCAAGQTIEGLRGSPTAVYVGVMCDDWSGIIAKDLEVFPQYGATGMARSIMSNRISYFFDWHGPSMTIDTACSSSLVAVHQAVQTLRSGESQVAIAAGANLILTPGLYVAESKLSMLSPSGRSRMWDKDVDGYARGEGIAAVVLKPLSAAIRDNDHIECLIRATGVNQDGRTPGLTMPSATAQAALIRDTYARAGLDINKPEDRPQFFHAHGTGTPAGDPKEAEAISRAFYSTDACGDKLYVGSIKTVIGHTEGTAGLASLISTSLAIQHGVIPPNMHFNTLNPRIAQFYHHLEVPTSAHTWRELRPGQPRRASINSFGFGGTNAHVILDAYEPRPRPTAEGPLLTPLTFSASSETSLRSMLSDYSEYLRSTQQRSLHDLAYSLQTRRSTLAYRVAITASLVEDACSQIDAIASGEIDSSVGTRQLAKVSPKILGVFTGQGSQWPRMGARLLQVSPYVAKRLSELDRALSESPAGERPTWTLREMILADAGSSRMAEAAISQPLCTAIQIVLVDLIRLAGVTLHAVVGHSSGEIGAAYAAGLLTARDAIRIAYYRGLYAKLAKSPNGGKGAMMAVGTTFEDASGFCELEVFKGRIQVAAQNSSSSITLSGDEDAVIEAIDIFKDEGKFARQLKVDTAYHSSHVLPCAKAYHAAMEKCGVEYTTPTGPKWHSSVREGEIMALDDLTPQYWVDNMTSPVLFSSAVVQAWADSGPFDLILEVGPHPVLKTPCLDTLEEITGDCPPYSGLLGRGKDDVQEFSSALGFIWTHLGAGSVDFDTFARAASGSAVVRRFLPGLPKYHFDRSRKFMSLSRLSGLHNSLQAPPHPLLGKRCRDRETSWGIQWRNILHPKEIPWLHGHQIQGQIVFPATGYIAMAVEAITILAGSSSIGLVSIGDLHIGRAMAFNDDDSSVETLFDVRIVSQTKGEIQAQFSCNSGGPRDHRSTMALNASGTVKVMLASQESDKLPSVKTDDLNTSEVAVDRFYESLSRLGYNYSWPFHGTTSIRRKADYATGTIEDQSGTDWEDQLIVHPGMLDTALQTNFAAFCCPGDERMWALHVPTSFKSIVINPYFTSLGIGKQDTFRYLSVAKEYKKGKVITELNLFTEEGGHTFLQIEGMELVPFSAALPENDAVLFSRFDYKLAHPDGELTAAGCEFKAKDLQIALDSERISFYYLRRLVEIITAEEKANTLPHYRHLVDWAAHVVPQIMRGENPYIPENAKHDTQSDIDALLRKHYERTDVRLLESVGENLPRAIRDRSNILEHMTKDGMLDDVYEEGFGLDLVNEYIARMTGQIAHRYPRMNILEIGAGSGGSTRRILPRLGSAFSTYTYTDVSGGFFGRAQDRFKEYASRMVFKAFDMNQNPASQGFVEGSYDLVIASNVLHATLGLEEMMNHVRSFLKPGGYLIILETVNNNCLRVGLPMGSLPGWWLGVESGRRWGPTLTLPQWDLLLRKCGFGGIDTTTPPVHEILPGHVFCAQALDERTKILRSPLVDVAKLPTTKAPLLVIIGGETLSVYRLSEQLSSILAPRFAQIIRIHSIEALNSEGLADSSTVLSLTELDEPLFATMTPGKLDGLKTLWRQSGNILWVTTGARAENPHCNMTLGVGRCMRFEYPNITLQVLDIDCMSDRTPGLIAEYLIRLELLDRWSRELRPGELMWSLEPEIYIQNDTTIIPRLYPYEAGNKRYNTSRRIVNEEVNPQEAKLVLAGDEGPWEVQRASPLHIPTPLPFSADTKNVRITHFLLSTISVLPGCRLMLCVGIDTSSHERLLAVTHTAESPSAIPSAWCFPIGRANAGHVLGVVSAYMMARSILRLTNKGDTLVVHEPHPMVASALKDMVDESVTLYVTTSSQSSIQRGWQHVDRNLPERLVKGLLPSTTTKFIDLSQNSGESDIGKLIARCLPRYCDIIDAARLFGSGTEFRPFVSKDEVSHELKLASSKIDILAESDGLASGVPTIQLQNISNYAAAGGRFAVADCTSPSVTALIRPIDEGNIFRPDKTYFLVGLSGELGQSLCKWMVVHGARYIALTSRGPKIHPTFIRGMERIGATVKALPMDITSRESLHACYESISKSMPPIAGVANGAMILQDALFDNMSYEAFTKVLSPKVLGSQLLDELFHDTPLDFFIFFSSTTAVMGNSGQSNYISGNMFMNALAAQRKKRGVAASSIDISSIIGIGYVERAEDLSEDTFIKMGYKPMSEQDLQQLFAEAIVLGRPDSPEICELATGVTPIYKDAQAKDQYLKDVKFGHFVMERVDTHGHTGKTSSVPVRVQLAEVKTKAEAVSIINESFIVRLRRILAVSPDESINGKVTLVEQGVDSLMAVEVRSWFLKELDVDIPVLKILGGSSITDLLNEALKLLPPSIVDLSALEPGHASQESVVKTSMPPVHPTTETRGPASSFNGDSTTDESPSKTTPGSTTTGTAGFNTPMTSLDLSATSIRFTYEKLAATTDSTDGSSSSDQPPDESCSPMSFGQAGFWFLNEYIKKKKAFNMAVMLELTGPIRIKSLEDAVRVIGNRHEILRTRFFWSGEGDDRTPMQGIRPTSAMKLTTRRIHYEAEAEAELQAVHNKTWDLISGDAVRISLLSLSDQMHFLLLGMHHIFLDGYSFSIFFKDLEAAYNMKTLPPLAPESQYRHFATQQRQMYENGGFNEMIEHYRKAFPADFKPIELLPFAQSATRQAMNNYSQYEATARIEAGIAAKVRQLARRNRSTSFHVYLSALQALLFGLLPGTDDIFIGIADANRLDKKFMGSMGFFLNLLPLHFRRREPGTTVSSIIQTARDTAYAALRHSQLPFDILLKKLNVPRSNSYTPIFQIFMDYRQVVQERSTWGGCKLNGEKWRNASTGYDIALEITENINTETLLSLRLQDALYSEESTQLLLRSYVNVLEFMADAIDGAVDDIPIWSPRDIQAALTAGKAPHFETKWRQPTIGDRIDEMTRAHGSRTALKDGNGNTLTYEQMSARIDTINEALQASRRTKGTVIGVFQEPSTDWICSMLAIFRAGAVYVPLDLRNSIARLGTIVKAARPTVILTDNTTTAKIPLIGASDATEILVSGLAYSKTQQMPQPNHAEADAQAVILFTSGSTGEPKGLNMTHANIVAFAEVSSRTFATSDDSLVVLQQSPFSFDFSLDQTFAALANGGCLYVVPARNRGDPVEISKIMVEERVTYTTATPSEYDMWLRYGASNLCRCSSWTYAFSGGEAMSHGLARGFATLKLSGLHLFNGYGPAETTILSTKVELNNAEPGLPDPLPAGFMLPGFSVCIVDANLQPVPLGVSGEIVIGGPCVVSGYFGDADSTKQKFIPDVFFGTSSKVYRSGDRGRLLGDGTLFVDGRLEGDTQVKLRGFRVELMEVENALVRHAAGALSHAIVTLRGSGEGRYLAAHVVFSTEYPEEGQKEVLKTLRHSLPLPPYMRPSIITTLADIPRTPHLKVDRKAIQAMPLPRPQEETHISENLIDAERKLCELWREVLPLDPGPLDAESDFFLVGGNSILLVRLQAMARDAFLAAPRLVTLMGASTLGAMAAAIEASRPSNTMDWETETRLPESLQRAAPLKRPTKTEGITVLLTGSAGYLGRHLLADLVEDPNIAQIICLLRHVDNDNSRPGLGEKVTLTQADVSQPNLGLSDDSFAALAEKTDVIVHCAANRSFWDRYEVLRPDNFDSVKELTRLAAHPTSPLHFMSSGAVTSYNDAGTTPPHDGSDGYVSTKWAAEAFLRRAAAALDIPVYIHRPVGIPRSGSGKAAVQADVVGELMSIAGKLGTRPSFDGVKGTVDVVPVDRVVQAVHRAVNSSTGAARHDNDGNSVRILRHEAALRVSVEDFATHLRGDDHLRDLPSLPILEWFGKAKKAGFGYFMTAQNLVMGPVDGKLISRR